MIFDLVFAAVAVAALFNGYKNGLLRTIIRTVFFIAGGVGAMYLVVKYNQSGWLILAIIVGAYAAAFVGTLLVKGLKVTIIRGPLRFLDSLLGSAFEIGKYVLLFYVIGTILLWAPWSAGQNSVSESRFYLQVSNHAPQVIADIKKEVEKVLANPRL
jgi:uncharacterized membrane protein required for colicin V production